MDDKQPAPYDIACDWLSFTMPIPEIFEDEMAKAAFICEDAIRNFPLLQLEPTPIEKKRGVYTHGFKLAVGGLLLFAFKPNHYLIEITGKGCRWLEETNQFTELVECVLPVCLNVTRYDLAVDFETELNPAAFAAKRNERWQHTDHILSDTGDTMYIGSKASDRQAKVYRYYPPHERSHLLRVEMTYRKDGGAFTALAQHIERDRVEHAGTIGKTFGWSHPLWCFDSDRKIKSWRPERGDAKTLKWIRDAVVPALVRLYEDDILDKTHPIWREIAERLPLVYDADAADV